MFRRYSIRSGRKVAPRSRGRKAWSPKLMFRIAAGILIVVAICSGILLAKTWLFGSELFRLARVEINGNRHTSQDLILRICNLRSGINLLSLDMDQLRRTIESLDWIRDARVTRELPDKLIISVKEYSPVALVNGNGLYLVDGNGEIFKKVQGREYYDLPIITGVDARQVDSGELPEYALSALGLISLASDGARTLGVSNISEIHVSDKNLIVYTMDKGIALHMDSMKLKQQFKRAEKVLLHLYRSGLYRKAADVDLAYADGVAWASVH